MYKPNYHITDKILNQIGKIEAIHARVNESYILPEREVEMRFRATVEATQSSTSIEGNPLNIRQVEQVSSNQRLTRHQYAEIEVKNYKQALDYIAKRKRKKTSLNVDDILRIHRIITHGLLPDEKSGNWRRNKVYIEDRHGNVVYTGPEARKVPRLINELLRWLETKGKEIHPVLAAAIFHIELVSIHPFADGNGRVTRALTMLILGLREFDFRGSIVLDTYYSMVKREYYTALSVGNNYSERAKANLNPWIGYFIAGFLSAAKVLNVEITVLANLARPVFDKERMSLDDADILSYAKRFGSVTISDVAGILPNLSRRTAQRKLRQFVRNGLLTTGGKGKNFKYLWRE